MFFNGNYIKYFLVTLLHHLHITMPQPTKNFKIHEFVLKKIKEQRLKFTIKRSAARLTFLIMHSQTIIIKGITAKMLDVVEKYWTKNV